MTTNNISAGYSGHTRLALQLDNGILTGNACLMSSGRSALSVQEAMSDVTAAATMHCITQRTMVKSRPQNSKWFMSIIYYILYILL